MQVEGTFQIQVNGRFLPSRVVTLYTAFTFINARFVGVLEEELLWNPVLVVGLVDATAATLAVEAVIVVAEEVVVVRGVSGGRRGRRR